MKVKYNAGINNPKHKKYRKGLSLIKHYTNCIDCNKKISRGSKLGRCKSCSKKGKQHPNFGKIGYWRNKKNPAQSKRTKGKNAPNWIDGRSYKKYPIKFNDKLRNIIRKRDNYICQNCGMTKQKHFKIYERNLHIHHIDYNRNNCRYNNLITLCFGCNIRANTNRKYWKIFYSEKIYANI